MSGVKNESKYQTETKAFDQTREAQPAMASLFDSNPANVYTMDDIFLAPISISASVPIGSKPSKPPTSPCESVPFYVSRSTSISTKLDDFTKVRQQVAAVLGGIEDLCYSYIDDIQCFYCKFSHGSSSREYHVSCYWDRDAQEHIVDVKKIFGDGFYRFQDINSELRGKFNVESRQSFGLMERSSSLLPKSSLASSSADFRSVPANLLDEVDGTLDTPLSLLRSDLFRDGIECLLAMMKHDFCESRVQGVKAICDVAASGEKINLCNAPCVQALVEALANSLRESGEVSEFTVNALDILSLEQEYVAAFSQSKELLRNLLGIIRNLNPEESYQYALMMRRSATILSRVAAVYPRETLEGLKQNDIINIDAWNQRLASYTDELVRKNLQGITNAFSLSDVTLGVALDYGVSPCDEKPHSIGLDHFYTNHAVYKELEAKLIDAFEMMAADTPSSYFPDSQCFKYKTQDGSSVILGHVNIFYDSDHGDHVVETRRVAGEVNFSSNMRDISASLQCFLQNGELPSLLPRSRPNATLENVSPEFDSVQTMVDSVKSMVNFVNDQYVENRIEGLKMLIDLALSQVQQGRNLVEHASCVAVVVSALQQRIKDSHFEVQEFAVIAVDAFCHFNPYKKAFLSEDTGIVRSLWNIVLKTSLAPCDKYQNAVKVRKAAAALFGLTSYDADAIRLQVPSLEMRAKAEEIVKPFATIDKSVYAFLQMIIQNIISSAELSARIVH